MTCVIEVTEKHSGIQSPKQKGSESAKFNLLHSFTKPCSYLYRHTFKEINLFTDLDSLTEIFGC